MPCENIGGRAEFITFSLDGSLAISQPDQLVHRAARRPGRNLPPSHGDRPHDERYAGPPYREARPLGNPRSDGPRGVQARVGVDRAGGGRGRRLGARRAAAADPRAGSSSRRCSMAAAGCSAECFRSAADPADDRGAGRVRLRHRDNHVRRMVDRRAGRDAAAGADRPGEQAAGMGEQLRHRPQRPPFRTAQSAVDGLARASSPPRSAARSARSQASS